MRQPLEFVAAAPARTTHLHAFALASSSFSAATVIRNPALPAATLPLLPPLDSSPVNRPENSEGSDV